MFCDVFNYESAGDQCKYQNPHNEMFNFLADSGNNHDNKMLPHPISVKKANGKQSLHCLSGCSLLLCNQILVETSENDLAVMIMYIKELNIKMRHDFALLIAVTCPSTGLFT